MINEMMETAYFLRSFANQLTLRVVENDQGRNDTRNPTAQPQQKDNDNRAATFVDNCQWWTNDRKDNPPDTHDD